MVRETTGRRITAATPRPTARGVSSSTFEPPPAAFSRRFPPPSPPAPAPARLSIPIPSPYSRLHFIPFYPRFPIPPFVSVGLDSLFILIPTVRPALSFLAFLPRRLSFLGPPLARFRHPSSLSRHRPNRAGYRLSPFTLGSWVPRFFPGASLALEPGFILRDTDYPFLRSQPPGYEAIVRRAVGSGEKFLSTLRSIPALAGGILHDDLARGIYSLASDK